MSNSHHRNPPFPGLLAIAAAALLFALTACNGQPKGERADADEDEAKSVNYIETGDLREIRKHGIIRYVTMVGTSEDMLPRSDIVTRRHIDLANRLAQRLRLEPRWIQVNSVAAAMELLQRGRADMMVGNFADLDVRRQRINFSNPILQARQILATVSSGPDISSAEKLRDVEIVVVGGTSYVDTARRIIGENPDANLSMLAVKVEGNPDRLVDILKEKNNRVTIVHDNLVKAMSQYRDDVRMGAQVSEVDNIAWGLRKNSRRLLNTVDNFLTKEMVKGRQKRIADWREIKKSGVIRFLTYNRSSVYFLWKGELMGFDYDLARAFAKKHKLHLKVIVVPYEETLIDWLKAGRGDFAGAVKNITQERLDQGIVFTKSYRDTPEQVVSNSDKPTIEKVQDLAGRTLTLRAFSPFIDTARTIEGSGIDVEVEIAPPDVSVSQILSMIAEGELDATITDHDFIKVEASVRPELTPGTMVSDPRPQGWMVMPQNWELRKKLNEFLTEYRKTEEYERKLKAYFEPNKYLTQRVRARIIPGKDLSPFDDLVKASAFEHNFDWRLVVAQMWQESNFNPEAVSPVGAQGLLQVMPKTAEDMGYPPPLFEPERGIKAGVKYLNWVRGRFDPTLSLENLLWFTLASYNAGYGHLLDAQRLAEQLGLDPNTWFDNVETAMLKLSEPEYFQNARYGYVRGAEPVQYVRDISTLYEAYTEVASDEAAKIDEQPANNREQLRIAPTYIKCRPPLVCSLIAAH